MRRSSGDNLPTLALPALARSAGDAVDASSLRYLSAAARVDQSRQRAEQLREEEQAWDNRPTRRKKKKKKLPRGRFSRGRAGRRQRQWHISGSPRDVLLRAVFPSFLDRPEMLGFMAGCWPSTWHTARVGSDHSGTAHIGFLGVRALPCGLDYVLFPLRLFGGDGFSVVNNTPPRLAVQKVQFFAKGKVVMSTSVVTGGLDEILSHVIGTDGLDGYAMVHGKIVNLSSTLSAGIVDDCTVYCHHRLRGGCREGVPGQRTCSQCVALRCWPVRKRRYRCGAASCLLLRKGVRKGKGKVMVNLGR